MQPLIFISLWDLPEVFKRKSLKDYISCYLSVSTVHLSYVILGNFITLSRIFYHLFSYTKTFKQQKNSYTSFQVMKKDLARILANFHIIFSQSLLPPEVLKACIAWIIVRKECKKKWLKNVTSSCYTKSKVDKKVNSFLATFRLKHPLVCLKSWKFL